jgi:hypothetical protein
MALLREVATLSARAVLAEQAALAAAKTPEPLSRPAAAKDLGIGVRTLGTWIRRGTIATVQPGGPGTKVWIPASEVERIKAGRPVTERRGRS